MAFDLSPITNFFLGSATGTLTNNFNKIKSEFSKTLYRDGTSFMEGPLDMNSKRIINVPPPADDNDVVNLASVRYIAQDIAKGPPGTSNNTYTSYSALMASDPLRRYAYLSGDTDTPPQPDGVFSNSIRTGGVWVRQSADGILATQGGTGAVTRYATAVLRDMPINPLQFGAVGDGVADDTAAIRLAISEALAKKKPLDLTVGTAGWKITAELDFTGLQMIYATFDKPIIAVVTGSYPRGFAVMIGDSTVGFARGRSDKLQLVGNLTVVATSRATVLSGVYIKGAFLNVASIRASGFNGSGIYADSVWDSFIGRLSVELCGSATSYALALTSNGDTTNATHIGSVQCEQAYQRGIMMNLLRCKVDNIHSERLAISNANDDHQSFTLSNSSVDQAVLHYLTSGTAPDGSAIASGNMRVRMGGDLCAFNEIDADGCDIVTTFGNGISLRNIIGRNWTQASPATNIEAHMIRITGVASVENDVTFTESTLSTLSPSFNGRNIIVNGGTISQPINFTNNILGNIVFNNVSLSTIANTGSPASGYFATTFRDCYITRFTGAFGSRAVINGGYTATASLESQSMSEFRDVEFGAFGHNGNTAYLTRNCRAIIVNSWSPPGNFGYPAGTVTERIGYDAGGKTYQQTTSPSGATWAPF